MRLIALLLALIALPAFAQTKTIRIVVPFGAGGGPDALARMIQPKLSENIGMPVIVRMRWRA